jgi:hypothetical protein
MSAEHERIRRRRRCQDCAPCCPGRVGIGVTARRPLRMTALDRVVQHVTGDHTALADPHAHMPGHVSRRSPEQDLAGESHIGFHRFDKPGVDYGLYGIGECGRVQRIVRLRKVIDISGPEQVTRAGERRYPFSVDQTRVPTHVIDMQVGADDEID